MSFKIKVTVLFLMFFVHFSFAQDNCQIKEAYKDIFELQWKNYSGKEYLSRKIHLLKLSSCFADFVNSNQMYLDYLLINYSPKDEGFETIKDSQKLQNQFIQTLQLDSAFSSIMSKIEQMYMQKENFKPDTVTKSEMLNIASKFFFVDKINEKDNFSGRICIGINGLEKYSEQKKPHVEAFCFSAIIEDVSYKEFKIYDEFQNEFDTLKTIDTAIPNEMRLEKARELMFKTMKSNEKLEKLLLSKYEKKKKFLPFYLKP